MQSPTREESIRALEQDWAENPRWKGIKRTYSAADVVRLAGSLRVEHTLARRGAEKLWKLVNDRALRQLARCDDGQPGHAAGQSRAEGDLSLRLAGCSRCQPVAGEMYPDQSLYPIQFGTVGGQAHQQYVRARGPDPAHRKVAKTTSISIAPIVADAEAGFGGVLNAFELMKSMIEAGAAGVHFEDQLASVKKCGHMGGKVLVPTREAGREVRSRRGSPPTCMGTPTLVIARTDAEAADLVTSDVDDNDRPFCTGERTVRRLLQAPAQWPRSGGVSWPCLFANIRGPALVRDRQTRPGSSSPRQFADAIHTRSSRARCSPTIARRVVQLEEESRRLDRGQVPTRARRDGLQIPVHHAGRFPQPELLACSIWPTVMREQPT